MKRFHGFVRHHYLAFGIVISLALCVIAFGLIFIPLTDVPRYASVTFKDETKNIVEVADTPELRAQGLSGQMSLRESDGMLFLFPEPSVHSFWMKDMQFPIDIIWLRGDLVVDVDENVQVEMVEPLERYVPDEPIDRVLELKAGFAIRHGIEIGDRLLIQIDPK